METGHDSVWAYQQTLYSNESVQAGKIYQQGHGVGGVAMTWRLLLGVNGQLLTF